MNNTTPISKPNNKGYLVGEIVDFPENQFEVEGETFYEGKIAVHRLSENVDILPFTISDKLIKAYDLHLEKGTQMALGGEFRSYNKPVGNRSKLILTFFIKEILDLSKLEDDNTNELNLTGYICKDPVFRTTPFNRQICDVLIAVNRPNFNKSDYIPCIMWGRNAKLIQNQKVGTKISMTGRIQSRLYRKEISEGVFEERTAYEVSCQKLRIEENANYNSNEEEKPIA